MNIWYAIPSADPERARVCTRRWQAAGYRVALWLDRPARLDADLIEVDPVYPGYFRAVNRLARRLVQEQGADVVVTGGDDLDPDPRVSAEEIGRDFARRFPDLLGVMQPTGDSLPRTDRQCGSPWLGREWVLRAHAGRGPFWPGYRHYFGDVELRHVAARVERLWLRPDLCQYHDQWRRHGGLAAMSSHQRRNFERHFQQDERLFRWRLRVRFPVSRRPWWRHGDWSSLFYASTPGVSRSRERGEPFSSRATFENDE